MSQLRNILNVSSLWGDVKKIFTAKIPPEKSNKGRTISIADCLMSACAMFSLKFPSLLAFDKSRIGDEEIK